MKRTHAGGYVLLEAVLALLIFSLGLLGMIGFQATAMRIATDSRFRTEAAMLADELLGRMAMSDVALVSTDFSSKGSKYLSWYKSRLVGDTKLPNPQVTVSFETGSTDATLIANVKIEWDLPDTSDTAKKREVHGSYTTKALLF